MPPIQPTRLNPADTDGNYFVNCVNSQDGTISSGVAYYKNLNPGQNVGQQPDDYVDVIHGSNVNWEQSGASELSRHHPMAVRTFSDRNSYFPEHGRYCQLGHLWGLW